MSRRAAAVLLLIALSCARGEERELAETAAGARGVRRVPPAPASEMIDLDTIDWAESVGIFIGVERFRRGAGRLEDVAYAADDATDQADFFTSELKLPRSRTVLLLAGRPHKATSRAFLHDLERQARVIIEDEGAPAIGTRGVDAETVYAEIRELGRKAGRKGIVVIFFFFKQKTAYEM